MEVWNEIMKGSRTIAQRIHRFLQKMHCTTILNSRTFFIFLFQCSLLYILTYLKGRHRIQINHPGSGKFVLKVATFWCLQFKYPNFWRLYYIFAFSCNRQSQHFLVFAKKSFVICVYVYPIIFAIM